MTFAFQPAVRQQRKARVGIIGPSGSGKTYTALQIAKGFGGRVALVDTENFSSSLYANEFQFDVLNLATFAPRTYVEAIRAAEQAGYDVLVIDSLSHAWSGKDGALEQVDKAAARSRSGNSFAAWREVTPMHNEMVEAIVRANMHVIVTMRAKTEYVIEQVQRGGRTINEPRKIGMAPVQRDGLEYEFDVVADMDWENRFIVSKTRASFLAGEVLVKPGPELGEQIMAWLSDGEVAPVAPIAPPQFQKTAAQPQSIADWKPSQPQLKRLFAIAKSGGVDHDGVRAVLLQTVGAASTSAIVTKEQYDRVCLMLEAGGVGDMPEDDLADLSNGEAPPEAEARGQTQLPA